MAFSVKPSTIHIGVFSGLVVTSIALFFVQLTLEHNQALKAYKYQPLRGYRAVSCEPDPVNNGKIVHIDCPITDVSSFYPPRQFSGAVEPTASLFFDTEVEMYQWKCNDGHRCYKGWSKNKEPDGGWFFTTPNPVYWPHVSGNGRQFPARLYVGGFELDPTVLSNLKGKRRLPIKDDGRYEASPVRPPQRLSVKNTQAHEDSLYSGDPFGPLVGDIRVSFAASTVTHLSVLGKQDCRHGRCFITPAQAALAPGQALFGRHQSLQSKADADGRMGHAIATAMETMEWAYDQRDYLSRRFASADHILSLYDDAILVREGDITGYRMMSDAASGTKQDWAKKWMIRSALVANMTIVVIWAYGMFCPSKQLSSEMEYPQQVLFILAGGGSAGVFASAIAAAAGHLGTEKFMGTFYIFLAIAALAATIYVPFFVLEPVLEKTADNSYQTLEMQNEAIHTARAPSILSDYDSVRYHDAHSMPSRSMPSRSPAGPGRSLKLKVADGHGGSYAAAPYGGPGSYSYTPPRHEPSAQYGGPQYTSQGTHGYLATLATQQSLRFVPEDERSESSFYSPL